MPVFKQEIADRGKNEKEEDYVHIVHMENTKPSRKRFYAILNLVSGRFSIKTALLKAS
ncbi:MAG: hypothetical protein WDA74_00970 [Spirochaetota bacterium]